MSADIIKFIAAVQNWFMRCEVCSIIDFYKVHIRRTWNLSFGSQHTRSSVLTERGLNIYLIKSLMHLL